MKKEPSIWKDVIIAVLAVYHYSLEKVDAMAAEFDKQGLFDPKKLSEFNHEEIFSKLEFAGYKRGNINAIFTLRLLDLGAFYAKQDLKHVEKILSGKDKVEISKLLSPIKGVGPKVLDNYFELRGLNG